MKKLIEKPQVLLSPREPNKIIIKTGNIYYRLLPIPYQYKLNLQWLILILNNKN